MKPSKKTLSKPMALLLAFVLFISCTPIYVFADDIRDYAMARASETHALNFAVAEGHCADVDKLLCAIFEDLGYDITVTGMGMAAGMVAASAGQYDGLSYYREGLSDEYPSLVMVPEPVKEISYTAYSKKNRVMAINTWDSLAPYRIGYPSQQEFIPKSLPADTIRVDRFHSNRDLADALENDKIDLAILPIDTPNADVFFDDFRAVAVLDKVPTYFYLNEMHKNLVPKVVEALRKAKRNGEADRIFETKRATPKTDRNTFLFLSSYGSDRRDYREQETALKEALLENPKNDVLTFNINPARLPSSQLQSSETTNYLRTQFASANPDVIIVAHNVALEYLEDTYFSMFSGTPVVYCAVNDIEHTQVERLKPYFTGVVESLAAQKTVEGILSIYPETEHIFVINDTTVAGIAAKSDITRDLVGFSADGVDISYSYRQSCANLLEDVERLPENSAILVGEYYEDMNGDFFDEVLFYELLRDSTDAPIFGLKGRDIGSGQLGGCYSSPAMLAERAAAMAEKLATGATISQVPPVTDTSASCKWVFDYNALEENAMVKNAAIEALHPTIINKPLYFKDINPIAFWLGVLFVVILAVLMGVLFVMLSKLSKRNAELMESRKSLHTAEEMLEKEDQLRAAKERTAQIIDFAPLVYVNTCEDVVLDSNRYAKEVLGLHPGDNILDLYTDKNERALALELLDDNGTLTGEILHFNTLSDGVSRFLVNLSAADWENETYGLYLWGINIEKSEQQKDSIERVQNDMQNLIEALPIPLIILNPQDATIIYSNRAHAMFSGSEAAESLIGKSLYDFLPETQDCGETSREFFPKYIQQVEAAKVPVTQEFRILTLQQREVDTRTTSTKIVYKGMDALIIILQDITAEKEKNLLLQSIAEREKEANELKSKFIVNMSHEIRTPMNAIIGLSGIELSKTKDRETFNAFQKINTSAKNLLSIVNEILDFSKIEDEKMQLVLEEFVVEDIVSDVLQVAMQRLDNRDIEIIADIASDLPVSLVGDKNRLVQVLRNILDNAVKFTNIGFIALILRRHEVNENNQILIEFEILDTGVGMKEHQVDRMFVPFEQFSANSGKNDGTGLGMSVTKQLVDLMHGEISVKSQYGVGTWVGATIPFDQVQAAPSLRDIYSQPQFEKKRVLIVDDSQICCDMMTSFLSSLSLEPTCVGTAKDAIELIRTAEETDNHFDLIILDYMLPEENGLVLAENIHKISSHEQKLLLMSAYASRIMPAEIERAGFVGIINKPFVPAVLIEKLTYALNVDLGEDDLVTEAQYPTAKVLIAEDNLINQEVALGMLEIFGIEPIIANNGAEAIELLEEGPYDLVLMDILMPVLNGHDATVKIRAADAPYSKVPIVAMTANAMQEEIDKCLAEGMNGHVAKPIDLDQLAKALAQWLPPETKQVHTAPRLAAPVEENQLFIDGVDTDDGVRRFANKQDKYKKALLSFARDIDPTLEELTASIESEDFVHARHVAHKLKGVAGNLGAKKVYSSAADFENILAEGKSDSYLFNRLKNASKTVLDSITTTFKSMAADSESVASTIGTKEDAMALLAALKTALEEFDPTQAEELCTELQGKRWEGIPVDSLSEIYPLIEDYMFDEALEKIGGLTEGDSSNV